MSYRVEREREKKQKKRRKLSDDAKNNTVFATADSNKLL